MMPNGTATSTTGGYRQFTKRSPRVSDTGGRLILIQGLSTNEENARIVVRQATDTSSERKSETQICYQLHSLETKSLRAPLSILIEQDGPGYIAQTIDMPLYGAGDTAHEAIEMLKSEIESLYNDLMEDDNFSGEWLTRKKLLAAIVF